MWSASTLLCLLPTTQGIEQSYPRTFEVELAEGEAFREAIEVDFEGTLHFWAAFADEGDADTETALRLRVFLEPGSAKTTAKPPPGPSLDWGQAAVSPNATLRIGVVCIEDGVHPPEIEGVAKSRRRIRLGVARSLETVATLETHRLGRDWRAGLEQLEGDDPNAARGACRGWVERLLALEGGAESDRVQDLLFDLGASAFRLGDPGTAARAFEPVLAYRRERRPESHVLVLHARTNLAMAWEALGRQERAVAILREVHEACNERTDLPPALEEMVMQVLGTTLADLGEFEEAIALQGELVRAALARHSADHPKALQARLNLATTQVRRGNLHAGRGELIEIVALRERTLDTDDPALQRARINLAQADSILGNWNAARELQEQALASLLRRLPSDHREVQRARLELAITLTALGQLEEALTLQRQVVKVRRALMDPNHPSLVTARMDVASSLKSLGRVDEARAIELELVDRLGARTDPDGLLDLILLTNLATSLAMVERHGEALELLDLVGNHIDRIVPEEHPIVGTIAHCALHSWVSLGRFDRAIPQLEAATERALAEFDTHSIQGAISNAGPFGAGYADLVSLAWTLALDETTPVLGGLGRADRLRAARCAFELTEGVRSLPSRAAQAHRTSLLHPEGPALWDDWSRLSREVASLAGNAGQLGAFQRALRERNELAHRLRKLRAERHPSVEHDLGRIREGLEEHEALVSTRSYRPWRPDLEKPVAPRLGAIVLRRSMEPRIVDLGPVEDLGSAVDAWYASLGQATPDGRGVVPRTSAPGKPDGGASEADPIETRGRALAARIMTPLEPALEGATACLLLPDGPLHEIPIDALPDPLAPGLLLGERLAWSRLGHIDTAREPEEARLRDAELDLLLVGAIEYGRVPKVPEGDARSAGAEFSFLPGTSRELELIRKRHGEAHPDTESLVLTGGGATAEAFMNSARKARVLHVATHGYFVRGEGSHRSNQDSLGGPTRRLEGRSAFDRITGLVPSALCGLAFAGALPGERPGSTHGATDASSPRSATGIESGSGRRIVTAAELATLDLRRCRLAVLSACESQLGVYGEGLGVHSLQAALHAAGAEQTIASLWKVPDEPTALLMGTFYDGLWRDGLHPARALWEAKLRVRSQYPDPLAWAAWVYTGRPRE